MSNLSELGSIAARILGNMTLVKAALAISATPSAVAFSAITTAIDGIMRTLAANATQALAPLISADFVLPTSQAALGYLQPSGSTGFYTQPAGRTVYYVLVVNAAGVVRVVQGLFDGQQISAQGLTVVGKSVVPDIPDTWVPFGIVKVVTVGSVFVPATTALTGIATLFDVMALPAAAAP